jgi:hypothetical protein
MSSSNPVPIAQSVFQSGPTDILKTVDVYLKISQDPVNSALNLAEYSLGEAIGAISNLPNVKSLLTKIDGAVHQAETTAGDAINRVENVVGGVASNLASLAGGVVNSLTQSVGAGIAGIESSISALPGIRIPGAPYLTAELDTSITYAGNVFRRAVSDPNSLTALTQIISTASPTASLGMLINSDQHNVMTALAKAVIPYRIPGIVDELTNQFTSTKDKTKFLVGLCGSAAAVGALDVINAAVAHCGSGAVLAQNPNLTSQVLNGYTFPPDSPGATPENATALYSSLVGVDPHWDTTMRNGTSVTDLTTYASASPNAQQCFAMLPETQVPMMIAGNYPKADLLAVAQATYPQVPILIDGLTLDNSLSA